MSNEVKHEFDKYWDNVAIILTTIGLVFGIPTIAIEIFFIRIPNSALVFIIIMLLILFLASITAMFIAKLKSKPKIAQK